MPSGERSQVWFPEVRVALCEGWLEAASAADPDWESIIGLQDRLQVVLELVLSSRRIVPAVVCCWKCGKVGPGRPPVISVRSVLAAVGRFGLLPPEEAKAFERAWNRHRAARKLNGYGRPVVEVGTGSARPGHAHGPGAVAVSAG
jgi:hypothetical protein